MKRVLISRIALGALAAAAGLAGASAEPAWNVNDTGQPTVEADFTVGEGTWMSVAVSPDGKTLAFDLLGDIYLMPAAGGDARLILGGPAMQCTPRFSPDGERLLFVSDAGGSDNIWIAKVDGSDARPVTHETTSLLTGGAWDTTGRYIVAGRMYPDVARLHASEIRLFDLAGGAGRILVETPKTGENVHEAQFSPDGRYLYYTHKVTAPATSVVYIDANHMNYAIERRDLQTGETVELLKGFGGATTPEVSPDGGRLAFVRRVKDRTVLFVYDLKTREQKPVYDQLDRDDQSDFIGQGVYYPQFGWFPDGRHVAIWGKGKLFRIDVDTGAAGEIPFRAEVRQKLTVAPRFSHDLAPDGFQVKAIRQIAYAPGGGELVFNALGRLWRQKTGGGAPSRLTAATDFEFEPAYSPDGRQIAYVDWNDEKGSALKLVAAGGGAPRTVAASPGVIREPAFSPDGKRLVYKIDEGDRCLGGHLGRPGLYLVDVAGGQSRRIADPGGSPRFSPDGRRIYFTAQTYTEHDMVTKLQSVDLAGGDRRDHAVTANADTIDLTPSPDLRWLAFKSRQQYYVTPLRETGAPLQVSADAAAQPVARLSELGGYALTWMADSSAVRWALGPSLYEAKPAQALAAPAASAPRPFAAIDLEVATDKPAGAVAFVGGRIITMKGEQVIERGTVLVEGDRIKAVGSVDEVKVPASAKVVDVSGKTLMPGLVDMHGHIDNCYYTSAGLNPQKQPSRYADLAYGVTTNYDPYTSELPTYAIEEMTKAGVMVGPRSIDVGLVAYGREGKTDSVYVPIDSYADAQAFMARKRALGGGVIKSYRQPMRCQRQELIKAGREAGIMVDVEGESHFYNNITMIIDGHMSLEHNIPVATYYDDVVQLMAHGNVAHTPTLVITFGEMLGENYLYQTTRPWEDPKASAYVQVTTSGYSPLGMPYGAPPYARGMTTLHQAEELWNIGFRAVSRSMKRLDDAGVIVNAGSHGEVAGLAMHWEMWLLSQGGMSNLHVLRTGTLNGARTLGLEAQIGSLEPGKLADLIVLDKNPLEDIHNTNTVRFTMVNGRLYDSLSMNEIGNYDRPRGRFFWETQDYKGIDWKNSWAFQ